jgi:hypothetical protein
MPDKGVFWQKNKIRMTLIQKIMGVALLLSLTFGEATAQDWEAGGWIGTSHYFGDLNPSYDFGQAGLAAGAIIRYNLNRRLAIKIGGNYGNISGSDGFSEDIFQRNRNLSFRSKLYEGDASFEFNFLKYEHGSKHNRFTPYIFAGVSLFSFNPEAEYQGQWYELQPLGTEGQFVGEEYDLTQVALNYGFGLKFDLDFRWSVNLFVSTRRLFTDYLDDVSTTYADKQDLEEARLPIAIPLSDRSLNDSGQFGNQRGNAQNNDTFTFFGVGLVYNFARINCPYF